MTAPGATTTDQSNNFYKVFNSIISTLNTASNGLDQINSKIGYAQFSLKTIQANHKTDETTLQNSIASDEKSLTRDHLPASCMLLDLFFLESWRAARAD